MNTNNNIQPVRSAFGTPTVAQAQAPPRTTNEPTHSFNINDIDFGFDDRGNLVVVPANQDQQSSEEVDGVEQVQNVDDSEESNTQPQQSPLTSTSFEVNDRITKLEGAIFQLASYLNDQEQTQVIQQDTTTNQNIDFQSDDWPNQIVTLINESVTKAIDEKLKPMRNDFNSMKVRNEFQDAAGKYGQPFLDLVPEMTEIKKSDPNISWDILYKSMSSIRDKYNKTQTQDSTIRTNDVVTSNGNNKALSGNVTQANQLRQKANQLKTESSTANANIAPQAKKVNSIDDAVEAALQELYG